MQNVCEATTISRVAGGGGQRKVMRRWPSLRPRSMALKRRSRPYRAFNPQKELESIAPLRQRLGIRPRYLQLERSGFALWTAADTVASVAKFRQAIAGDAAKGAVGNDQMSTSQRICEHQAKLLEVIPRRTNARHSGPSTGRPYVA